MEALTRAAAAEVRAGDEANRAEALSKRVKSLAEQASTPLPSLVLATTPLPTVPPAPPAPRHQDAFPPVVAQAFNEIAEMARQALERGSADGAQPQSAQIGHVFSAVQMAMPLHPPIIKHDPATGRGSGDKNLVGLSALGKGGRKCVVYGMGISSDSGFEEEMGRLGCETHAFDCTVDPTAAHVNGKPFNFHHWCIGEKGAGINKDSMYLRGKQDKDSALQSMQFKKLSETMRELGHSSVDVLKFDIEGFEWDLFEHEILKLTNPPKQIAFELHTQGAHPWAVPPHLVAGKGYVQVNKLFLRLYDMGYRAVSKEINEADYQCAEFVMVNVNA